jgi:hypothetical protein
MSPGTEQKLNTKSQPKAPGKAVGRAKTLKPRGRPPKAKALTDFPSSGNNVAASDSRKTPRIEVTLERVMEEPEEDQDTGQDKEIRPEASDTVVGMERGLDGRIKATEVPRSSSGSESGLKKKRRKLQGRGANIVFEDDEGERERTNRLPKAQPVASRGLSKAVIGRAKNPFTGSSFSPLKRDRRGLNASFLA